MLFNSIDFFIFFPIVLIFYYSFYKKKTVQNFILLIASYFFYGWWDWRFVFLLMLSTCIDYFFGLIIYNSTKYKKLFLVLSLVNNLAILCFFKYYNFFAASAQALLAGLGFKADFFFLNIILPVGISFYTFHGMSYVIDIYRGNAKPTKNFIDYSVFVCFFPLLVAGPIERATHLLPQIINPRKIKTKQVYEGVVLIIIGLFRKIVIADNISPFVEKAFAFSGSYSSVGLIIGVALFAVQIYCDFAGYSEIARGTAKMMGFELIINFREPYFSSNITEFWRRWHISLSSWLRDYLYISLGGNRNGKLKTYRNLIITMFLGGLWHGASWMFIIWGLLHGIYLAVHKWWLDLKGLKIKDVLPQKFSANLLIKILATNVLVCFAWIFFRAKSLGQAFSVIKGIVFFHGSVLDKQNPGLILEPGLYLLLSVIAILLIDIPKYKSNTDIAYANLRWWKQGMAYAVMLCLIMLLSNDNEAQFIYFQF